MAMPINSLMISDGDSVYYDNDFRLMIESHMGWLRSRSDYSFQTIDPFLAYKYRGDFDGLMLSMGIPAKYHWFYLRLNDYTSPREFKGDETGIYYMPEAYLDQLRTRYNTAIKKVT